MSVDIGELVGTLTLKDMFTGPLEEAGSRIVSALSASVGAMTDMADRMTNLSERTGIGVEALQKFDAVGSTVGQSAEAIATSYRKFSQSLEGGSAATTAALNKLGLSAAGLKKQLPEDQMKTMITSLAQMQAGSERTALATQLLGRAGAALVPIGTDYENLSKKAERLGFIMSKESIAAADNLGDAYGFLQRALGGVETNIGATITSSEALTQAVDFVSEVVGALSGFIKDNQEAITAWVDKGINFAIDVAVELGHEIISLYDSISRGDSILNQAVAGWDAVVEVMTPLFDLTVEISESLDRLTNAIDTNKQAAFDSLSVFTKIEVAWNLLKVAAFNTAIAISYLMKAQQMLAGHFNTEKIDKQIESLKTLSLQYNLQAQAVLQSAMAKKGESDAAMSAHEWLNKLRADLAAHSAANQDAADKTRKLTTAHTESAKSMEAFAKISVDANKQLADATLALLPPMEQQHAKIQQQMENSIKAAIAAGVHGESLAKLKTIYEAVAAAQEKKIVADKNEAAAAQGIIAINAAHDEFSKLQEKNLLRYSDLMEQKRIHDLVDSATLKGSTVEEGKRLGALALTMGAISKKMQTEILATRVTFSQTIGNREATEAELKLRDATIALIEAEAARSKKLAEDIERQKQINAQFQLSMEKASAFASSMSTVVNIFESLGGSADSWFGQVLAGLDASAKGGEQAAHGMLAFNKEGATSAERLAGLQQAAIGVAQAFAAVNSAATASGNAMKDTFNAALAGGSAGAAFGPHGAAAGALFGTAFALGSSEKIRDGLGKVGTIAVSLLSPAFALGAIFNSSGKQAEKARQQFIESSGGIDILRARADKAGVSLDALFDAKKPERVAREIKNVTAAIEAQEKLVRDHENAWGAVNEAVERYGFEISELGPAMAQQKLDEIGSGLLKDWNLLIGAGVDYNAVLERMGPNMNEYVQNVIKAGGKIPLEMKGMIQSWIDAGKLTDEAGNKFMDVAELPFAEDLNEKIGEVVDAIHDLIDALKSIPDVTVKVHYKVDSLPDPKGGNPPATRTGARASSTSDFIDSAISSTPLVPQTSMRIPTNTPGSRTQTINLKNQVNLDGREMAKFINRGIKTGKIREMM